jgi:O-antigen ligase
MASVTTSGLTQPARVGVTYQLLISAYVVAIILFNREGGFLLAIPKIIALLIALAFIVSVIGQRRKIYVPMTYGIWALWFLVAITSTLLADDVRLGRIVTLTQLAGIGFMITHFLIWNRNTGFYVLALIGGVAASSMWILVQPEAFIVLGHLSGTIGNANAHGVLISVGMIFSLVIALGVRRWIAKVGSFLLASWFFVQILQTGSRQAILGGIVIGGGAVGAAYLYRNWCAGDGSFTKSLLLALAAAPVAVVGLITSEFWFRLESAQEALQADPAADGSVAERMFMIRRGIEMWADRPMLGTGLDSFRFGAEADHLFASAIGAYAHNNYIEILVGTGLIGLFLYLFIYLLWLSKLFILRSALRHKESFVPYVLVLSVVFLVIATDFTRVSHYEKLFWLLLPWIVAELHLLETGRTRPTVVGGGRKEPQNGQVVRGVRGY